MLGRGRQSAAPSGELVGFSRSLLYVVRRGGGAAGGRRRGAGLYSEY